MDGRITVNLAGTRVEQAAARVTRQLKQIHDAQHRALERLDRVCLAIEQEEKCDLVVNRSSRARKIVDLVHFEKNRLTNVVKNEIEVGLALIIAKEPTLFIK